MTNDCKSRNQSIYNDKYKNETFIKVKAEIFRSDRKKQASSLFFCLLTLSKLYLESKVAGSYKYARNQRQYRGKKHDVNDVNDKGVFTYETD